MSSAVYGLALHWRWFLRKIWTTEQPTSRPRHRARSKPPAMDMWAPSRSRIEGPRELPEVTLEPGHSAAKGGAAAAPPAQQPAFDQGQEPRRDLLRAPAAARVVPLVEPGQHAE